MAYNVTTYVKPPVLERKLIYKAVMWAIAKMRTEALDHQRNSKPPFKGPTQS